MATIAKIKKAIQLTLKNYTTVIEKRKYCNSSKIEEDRWMSPKKERHIQLYKFPLGKYEIEQMKSKRTNYHLYLQEENISTLNNKC